MFDQLTFWPNDVVSFCPLQDIPQTSFKMASKTGRKAAGFTLKLYGRLKRLARDKYSSFPRLFIRNEKKK
jgi:hypothetical protein